MPRYTDLHDEQHALEQQAMSNSRTPGARPSRKRGSNVLPARLGQVANAGEGARCWRTNVVEP
jgi:hypothetical protein